MQRPWARYDAELGVFVRYMARVDDRIAAACWVAEHDPGTEDAWRDGCTCDRDGSVTWGCPLHDPEEE